MSEITITVNGRMMLYSKTNDVYSLDKLKNTDKLGKICYWEIYVIDNNIYRKSYQEGGKIREFPPSEIKGKNIGKKNETTDQEQALFEAYTMWTKKQTQGYTNGSVTTPSTDSTTPTTMVNASTEKSGQTQQCPFLPMLANKFTERKHHLKYPYGVSRKLDGVRVITSPPAGSNTKDVFLYSRMGKPFSFLDNIRMSLKLLLQGNPNIAIDGELYSHSLPFNAISGAVRTKKKKSEYDDRIELWIFDLVDMTNDKTKQMGYEDRMRLLKQLENNYNSRGGTENLKFVYFDLCMNHDQIEQYHKQYIEEGFEGIMCRNLLAPYQPKTRSNDLLKYKDFLDEEFVISGAKPGVGTEKGAIVFECTCPAGVFDVRPRGSIQSRQEMYMNKSKYIGKKLTVRYQATGDQSEESGIPRFPVGIDVRDYE